MYFREILHKVTLSPSSSTLTSGYQPLTWHTQASRSVFNCVVCLLIGLSVMVRITNGCVSSSASFERAQCVAVDATEQ